LGIGFLASVRDPVVKEDNFIVQDGGFGSGMIEIPEQELVFKTSRSSGPGGQNVNKVSTRVTVLFDVANTACLSDSQKKRALKKLATRASKAGVIRVVSQRYRTQKANRRAAVERLQELLRKALSIKPVRKKTWVPMWAKERRLEEKKRRGTLKRERAQRNFES
jgi:ribosome-associated protein